MSEIEKQEEFLSLLQPALPKLSNFARAIARNAEDARDLASETILKAYENFDSIKKKDSFKSYLFTIAIRLNKRNNSRRRFFADYDDEQTLNIPSRETPADVRLDVEALYAALALLHEKQRNAIALFEISGFSIEEIRRIQGGTNSAVKSRLKRGREKLAELLGVAQYQRLSAGTPRNGESGSGVNETALNYDKAYYEK